ncbi:MAG: glycosyltransferase [Roseiarcus sp.]
MFAPPPPTRRDSERVRGAREGGIAVEIAFLASYGMPPGPLLAATRAAHGGVTADQALVAEGPMREEDFYRLLARHLGAPYYRAEMKIGACDPAGSVASGIAPLAPNAAGLRHVLAPRGRTLALLLAAAPKRSPPAFAICSPQRLGAALRRQKGRRLAREAAGALERADPALSAHTNLGNGQLACAALLAFGAPLIGVLRSEALSALCAILVFAAFAASVALRLAATAAGAPASAPAPAPAPLDERELPVYSIIAPLYREAKVAARLVEALDAIDYPRSKLDIKIVVERDDLETLTALARMRLPSRYDVIVAPPGAPATKPRALNVALPFARGDLIVIYDAEDAPAPDQLRRAAARFSEDPAIDCLQARLVVDNIDDSWLTSGITAQTPQDISRIVAHLKGHERAFQQIRARRTPRETRRNRWRDHASRAPSSPSARNRRACRRDIASIRS